jgi:hypothetical protein
MSWDLNLWLRMVRLQMSYIPDVHDLWERHMTEQEAQLDKLPRCCECGEPIQQETAVYINDDFICDECLATYRRAVLPEW